MQDHRRIVLALAIACAVAGCQRGAEDASTQDQQVKAGMAAYEAGRRDAAREAWTPAAAAGNADAQYFLGVMANEGRKPDYKAAFDWFKKAADHGHHKARYNLALAYERGQGVARDRKQAITILKALSAEHDADAQYMLGLLLLDQNGPVQADAQREAVASLEQAATAGNARAQYVLGTGYADGSLGGKQPQFARRWLGKAIASGSIEALRPYVALAQQAEGDHSTPIATLARDAEAGNARAQHAYAARLFTGEGVAADPAKALEWLRKAAAQGEHDAEYDLGIETSRGDKPDYPAAMTWLQRAARGGHARAQYAIGQMYADGLGVDKDETQAVAWYRKAADAQLPAAEYAMGYAYSEGAGVQRDDAAAMTWFRKAAGHGHGEAAFRISTMYDNGEGVGKDPGEKARWLCRAAVLGGERALAAVERKGGFDSACAGLEQDLATFARSVLDTPKPAPSS